jgi:hypothetical protein
MLELKGLKDLCILWGSLGPEKSGTAFPQYLCRKGKRRPILVFGLNKGLAVDTSLWTLGGCSSAAIFIKCTHEPCLVRCLSNKAMTGTQCSSE